MFHASHTDATISKRHAPHFPLVQPPALVEGWMLIYVSATHQAHSGRNSHPEAMHQHRLV